MTTFSLEKELKENSYPGRGIVIGRPLTGNMQLLHILLWEEARTAETEYL